VKTEKCNFDQNIMAADLCIFLKCCLVQGELVADNSYTGPEMPGGGGTCCGFLSLLATGTGGTSLVTDQTGTYQNCLRQRA
jgi:hypothetical protein